MKVTYDGRNVVIKMTRKQLSSLFDVFSSFTDQVDEENKAYGDCVVNINRLIKAIAKANIRSEDANQNRR